MGYYRGDYYQGDCPNYAAGDYYRGDPFLGGLIGAIAKPLLKKAVGFISGFARKKVGTLVRQVAPVATGFLAGRSSVETEAPMIAPPELQGPVGTMLSSGFIPGCQLKGTRPNKSGYYKQVVKGNPTQVVYIPKGSVCVKSRRLNVANPRALRRAIRRAQGFGKLARRVLTFVSAKAPKGRAKFKKAR